jgi:hypothetical protein
VRLNEAIVQVKQSRARLLEVTETVYGRLYGSKSAYIPIKSTDQKIIFETLTKKYNSKCSGCNGAILKQKLDERTYLDINEGDVIDPNSYIELIPIRHTIVFQFRSLTGDESLRVIAKRLANRFESKLGGEVRRVSKVDIEVIAHAYTKELLQQLHHSFTEYGISNEGTHSLAVGNATFSRRYGIVPESFLILKNIDITRDDNKISLDSIREANRDWKAISEASQVLGSLKDSDEALI